MAAYGRPARGFTVIELMVVVVVSVVLLSLAVPSFRGLFAKKRVEGVAAELSTNLQYARAESVSRNALVQVTFGTNCYVIHPVTLGASAVTASCTQTTKSILPAAAEIKTVQVESVTLSPQGGLTSFVFDPVRGTPNGAGSIDATSSVGGSWQLRLALSAAGRTSMCSPNSSVSGFSTSC